MLKQIKDTFLFNLSEQAGMIAVMFLVAVMGMAITLLVNLGIAEDGENKYILMASFIVFITLVMVALFAGMMSVSSRFNMMISMGRTRKEFFMVYLSVEVLYTLLQLGFIWLVVFIEWLLKKSVYAGRICSFDCSGFLLDVRTILCILLLLPSLKLFMGALYMKFGVKAYWVLCIALMVFGFSFKKGTVNEAFTNIIEYFVTTGSLKMLFGLGVLCVALISTGTAILILRKQAVRTN